jgi:hypothetical protein
VIIIDKRLLVAGTFGSSGHIRPSRHQQIDGCNKVEEVEGERGAPHGYHLAIGVGIYDRKDANTNDKLPSQRYQVKGLQKTLAFEGTLGPVPDMGGVAQKNKQ